MPLKKLFCAAAAEKYAAQRQKIKEKIDMR